MRIVTVVGNRPQFVKAAAVSRPLRERHQEVLIHTGQHHDDALSAVFFRELDLPVPDHEMSLGGGSNLAQTSRMIAGVEALIRGLETVDAVLVYGDTNTTLAGALVAADLGIPLVHVEAGMRSYDRRMPEERNRVVCDHLSSLLLVPTAAAVENLRREGITERVLNVGDVMTDVTLMVHPRARERTAWLAERGLQPGGYRLATVHRAGNVDTPERLAAAVETLRAVSSSDIPLVLPLHPRTAARLTEFGLDQRLRSAEGVRLVDPVGPMDFAALLVGAETVVTDSGGVQKEAYLAGVRCVTLRDTTEWTETVDAGWNHLVDLDPAAAVAAVGRSVPAEHPDLYGDGYAGQRVVQAIEQQIAPAVVA